MTASGSLRLCLALLVHECACVCMCVSVCARALRACVCACVRVCVLIHVQKNVLVCTIQYTTFYITLCNTVTY